MCSLVTVVLDASRSGDLYLRSFGMSVEAGPSQRARATLARTGCWPNHRGMI
jgi:hypothetical protein